MTHPTHPAHRLALRARGSQHYAYSGRSLLVTNPDGAVTGGGEEGFYVENTRLLSREEFTVDGRSLTPAGVSPVGGAGFLAYFEIPEGPGVPAQAVYLELARFVDEGMRTVVRLRNYSAREAARFELAVHLAADFADSEEAKEGRRQQTAEIETAWHGARQELACRYRHPDLDRSVTVRVERSPDPARFEGGALVVPLDLPPRGTAEIDLAVEPVFDGRCRRVPPTTFDEAATPLGRVRQRLREETPRLATTNATVAQAWRTATADLATLPLGLPAGPAAPIAGLPLYQQFFGRDTLTIAWQALLAMPDMLRDTLRKNAAWQGTRIDDWLDEEPGKLIHQARWGPLSLLGLDPFARYYGDYATPPDFLIMLGQYLAWTADLATTRALLPAARRAIEWLDRYADLDGDGFIEYLTRSEQGVEHQGWKDSFDAIVDQRGEIIDPPVATSELQGYWYAGLEQAGLAFLAAGDRGYGLDLLRQARDLKRRFDRAFWMEDEGFYALALGPDKRPVRSIASNAGHLLAAGIVPPEKGYRVARRLLAPDLFSGWGVRTLSSAHPAYHPFSYHRGSVWPVENGTIAFGLARYGCWDELHRLAEGLFASTELFAEGRLPEALGGIARDAQHPHPGIYPQSNEPQGWSASVIVLTVQALLGLRAAALPGAPWALLLVDPHLPAWLPDLRLAGVRVGQASVDLEFRRTMGGETRYRVTRRTGAVRVLRQPVPRGRESSLRRRAVAALASLPHG